MNGAMTSMRCRSEPQMPLEVTSMMTSVGSWMAGSGNGVHPDVCSAVPGHCAHVGISLDRAVIRPLQGPSAPS